MVSYYGSHFWPAQWASWRERRRGQVARANARWGALKVPGDRGPVLWMQSPGERDALRLGIELGRAMSDKRQDLRMLLTFEDEPPGLFPDAVQGIARLGYGFGPCAHPRALSQTLDRLQPLRYMAIGRAPSPQLQRLLGQRQVPAVVIGADLPSQVLAQVPWESLWPRSLAQHRAWAAQGLSSVLQDPVDFLSLVTVAQVEPNFRHLALGMDGERVFWVQGLRPGDWGPWQRAWAAWPGRSSALLFLGGTGAPTHAQRLSTWDRSPIPLGSVVLVDDPRWWPALAAGSDGVHLQQGGPELIWQIFAGGRPLSRSVGMDWALPVDQDPEAQAPVLADPGAVLNFWAGLATDPLGARQLGDAFRRVFWQARREAGERLPSLLQQVFDW